MTGTSYMAKEILSQPKIWMSTFESAFEKKESILSFLEKVYMIPDLQIILTGAGSSAFIGEILQYSFHKHTGRPVRAIPTTDLVTHPTNFFGKSVPTLMVSFARSGDSPESVATFDLAEKLIDNVFHLVITCNPEGKLAGMAAGKENSFTFLLPEEANDQALAMTSSFTSMTLAGLLISDINNIENNYDNVKGLVEFGKHIIENFAKELDQVTDLDFKRIVFLGSGPLKGTAQESHLKVIELTDGNIMCQFDSFLGFRHGPRAIIDGSTLLIYLFSEDPYVGKYENDLVRSINQTEEFIFSIGIGQSAAALKNLDLNLAIGPVNNASKMSDDFFAICSIIPAQVLGFYKSLAIGLTPDSPSKSGGIHRVVQGVTIYPC
jgi:tagatose-6-phosphate ketose/aldose isomerase